MTLQIRNIPVIAIAGETSMNGLSKFPLIDLLGVAANAIRVVDAFGTILAALNCNGVSFFPGSVAADSKDLGGSFVVAAFAAHKSWVPRRSVTAMMNKTRKILLALDSIDPPG